MGVGANPGRRDRWPPFRRARLVLVRRARPQLPWQGVIIDWRRQRDGEWEAQVAYVDDESHRAPPALRIEWIAAGKLTPVPVDPNIVTAPWERRGGPRVEATTDPAEQPF